MKIVAIKSSMWVKVTISPLSNLNHLKRICKKHDVEILEIEELGGWIFKKYRLHLRGFSSDIIKVSQY